MSNKSNVFTLLLLISFLWYIFFEKKENKKLKESFVSSYLENNYI